MEHWLTWALGMVIALGCAYVTLLVNSIKQQMASDKESNLEAHNGFREELKTLREWRHDLEDARSGYLAAEFMKGKR